MVLDIIDEKPLEIVGEGMVGLDLDQAQVLAYGQAFLPEGLTLGNLVEVPQEMTRIVGQRVVAFLEFVEFFDDGDRNHQVIVPETPYGFVVVQGHVGVQHENLRFAHISFSLLPLPLASARGIPGYSVCRSSRRPSPARHRR